MFSVWRGDGSQWAANGLLMGPMKREQSAPMPACVAITGQHNVFYILQYIY